ncbi:hypothetical protein GGI07_002162 [Coemansia sp. Benny D115]|nr:hypothetical protein GGI07_002162 [Coemansia sp. Benny D115]
MAEYIYVDKNGLKPLAIYLNPTELEHVEMLENSTNMSDDAIAQSLREQEVDGNPNRRSDLLFQVVRHLQYASGNQATRVVNEKIKNVRSRIINWFVTMFHEGELPSKRPVRYVVAILDSLTNSPFASVADKRLRIDNAPIGTGEIKHDVNLWLEAMFWLHPKNMHEFVYWCAVQVARTQSRNGTPGYKNKSIEQAIEQPNPDLHIVLIQLQALAAYLNQGSSLLMSANTKNASKSANIYGNSSHLKKRKRKNNLNERQAEGSAKGSSLNSENYVICNDNKKISISMFEMLKNEDKLKVAGMRVKMIAAVGGVIRSSGNYTELDIKYNLYRLWTCVSRFADISSLFQLPGNDGKDNTNMHMPKSGFAELVVVQHFGSSFSEQNVEPAVRVSKIRQIGYQISAEEFIKEQFCKSKDEYRTQVPIWLTICKRSDNQYVLALIITHTDVVVPMKSDMNSGIAENIHRNISSQALEPIMDMALSTGGVQKLNGRPLNQIGGMDMWPWSPQQIGQIDMSLGYFGQISITTDSGSQLVVSTSLSNSADAMMPWAEPRVLTVEAYSCQQALANINMVDIAPEYQELYLESTRALAGKSAQMNSNTDISAMTAANAIDGLMGTPMVSPLMNSTLLVPPAIDDSHLIGIVQPGLLPPLSGSHYAGFSAETVVGAVEGSYLMNGSATMGHINSGDIAAEVHSFQMNPNGEYNVTDWDMAVTSMAGDGYNEQQRREEE